VSTITTLSDVDANKSFSARRNLFRQHLRTSCLGGGERLPSWCQSISQCVRRSAACRAAGNQSGCRTPERHRTNAREWNSAALSSCRSSGRRHIGQGTSNLIVDRRATGLLAEPLAQASEPPRPQMGPPARPKSRGQPHLLRPLQALTRGGRLAADRLHRPQLRQPVCDRFVLVPREADQRSIKRESAGNDH
jgi:hypothetical protein